MRISDWSSDVCSSDLADAVANGHRLAVERVDFGVRERDGGIESGAEVDPAGGIARAVEFGALLGERNERVSGAHVALVVRAMLGKIGVELGAHRSRGRLALEPRAVGLLGTRRDDRVLPMLREQDRKSTRLNSSH